MALKQIPIKQESRTLKVLEGSKKTRDKIKDLVLSKGGMIVEEDFLGAEYALPLSEDLEDLYDNIVEIENPPQANFYPETGEYDERDPYWSYQNNKIKSYMKQGFEYKPGYTELSIGY